MILFKIKQIQDALNQNFFIDFLRVVTPFYEHDIHCHLLEDIHWDVTQKKLQQFIITALNHLTDKNQHPPSEPIKGVYCCLADDGMHFSIHGSLYYREDDWAANADYDYLVTDDEFLNALSITLVSVGLNNKQGEIDFIMCLFAVFVLFKTLHIMPYITQNIADAGIAIGYCDGDILELGHFSGNQFIEQIALVENGEY